MAHEPLTQSKVGAMVEGSILEGFEGIDGTPIGANTPAAAEFTTLECTGVATLGGDVLIAGDPGFYGGAAVPQPTGVAVTEIAIHAALVTLGLITA